MLYQGTEIPKDKIVEYDVCIAGSGAAGMTLALELEKQNYSVVILEAGEAESSKQSQSMYRGKSTGLKYSVAYSRLRVLGGTTQHWAGFCAPLDEEDFKKRDHIPHSGWPISRQDLDPYYVKAAKRLRLGDYSPDPEDWIQPEKGYNSFEFGEEFVDKIWHYNKPLRFGTDFKRHIEQSKKVDLYLSSALADLAFDSDSDQISKATVQTKGQQFFVKAKEFVVACGGIETPRLLLNFNKQRKKGLGNKHDNVGRYFQEHPEFHHLGRVSMTGPNAKGKLYLGHHRVAKTFGASYFQINRKTRDEKNLLNAAFHLSNQRNKPTDFDDDVQEFSDRLNRHQRYANNMLHLQCIVEQQPDRNRRVTLSSKQDALGLYQPNINIGLTELDCNSIQKTLIEFTSIVARYKIGRVQFKHPEILQSHEAVKEHMGWGNHHMGATRMSDTPEEGVVDKNCKVHEVNNLYIGGSSVFTTSGCVNPTFTIVALALRLAEHLDEKMKGAAV